MENEKKYAMLSNDSISRGEHTLFRIMALRDIRDDVKKGDFGGYIERESNLSQEGSCWVYPNARVYDYAKVKNDAVIRGWGVVCDSAIVKDSSIVEGDATIRDRATIFDNVIVDGKVFVSGDTVIYECAHICDEAEVSGVVHIGGEVVVDKEMCITSGVLVNNSLEESIRCQTGLLPIDGEVIAYKQVNKDLTSFYDPEFQYKIGEWVEAKNPAINDESCAEGLHFSNATYWNIYNNPKTSTFLAAKIKLEDIITVQQGKIRCKKAFIIGKYDIQT